LVELFASDIVSCKNSKLKKERKNEKQTRPLSDSEAATMYKLKGQSSNMQTGQNFKNRELVRLADPYS